MLSTNMTKAEVMKTVKNVPYTNVEVFSSKTFNFPINK